MNVPGVLHAVWDHGDRNRFITLESVQLAERSQNPRLTPHPILASRIWKTQGRHRGICEWAGGFPGTFELSRFPDGT